MRLCPQCDQPVAEEITLCPACGNEIGEGRKYIDDYRIVDILHEGHSSFLCRAIRERTGEMVMIRLFTPQSGVDETVAARLTQELERLKRLPDKGFVRHYAIRQSTDGLWYRISEWIDTESWGSLLTSGRLQDRQVALDLFFQMASILTVLHQEGYFIPHLILNDIMLVKAENGRLQVKIDYKLSRFFDPKLDRPGPMLKKLLNVHPDIINHRPLDFRSDIWSLGKIFVELLSADLDTSDYLAKVDELNLPEAAKVLLKVMLADDPDIRPRSMAEVAVSLARIKEKPIEEEPEPVPPPAAAARRLTIKGLQNRISILAVLIIILSLAGFMAWYQLSQRRAGYENRLENYANQYSPSVAFLLVEYWLEIENEQMYRNLAEGTAFLVDSDGYMLTSRHVVCPWLEDSTLLATVQHFSQVDKTPELRYRIFLWFEGARAFNRVSRLIESPDLSDVYFIENAFSTESEPRLSIAGVPKPPVQTRQVITSPLKDDFAVIKIDQVPEGLEPLPLELKLDSKNVPKLSRLITIGFPLGSRTQDEAVNASVTGGNVRRSFENVIQVDTSLYSGNSGGPIIDVRGKVIGIAAGVAMDIAQGLMQTATPRWDLGMVLPITNAAMFLEELKAGQAKWNGELDFSIEKSLEEIKKKASEGLWAEAQALADEELKGNPQPEMIMAAGMIHYCTGDNKGAANLFSKTLSMDPENPQARLMQFLIDWLAGEGAHSPYREQLLALDWRSPAEFQGHLVRVLEDLIDEVSALDSWHTDAEKSWLCYAVSLIRIERQDWEGAEKLLRKAVLTADTDAWEYFVVRAKLEQLQKRRRNALKTKAQWKAYNQDIEAFNKSVKEKLEKDTQLKAELPVLMATFIDETVAIKEKREVLAKISEIYPDNRKVFVALAFYSAADGDWKKALEYISTFLDSGGRQNADRMSLGILQAGISNIQGQADEARSSLEAFAARTMDPWYLSISDYLLGNQTERSLLEQAGESPENLLTAHTAVGCWAEGGGDKQKAIKHYREALGSFLDMWLEYDFAKERLRRLKLPQPSG
ncbi:MAG: trypsin-like peptidase domain-containing protein [Desulfobacterales bacterium]|jgi:serine/threonine protein kinase/tetratricopeptide (TPR) repeat protein